MIPRRVVQASLATLLVAMCTSRTAHALDPLTWRSFDGGGAAFASAGGYELGGTIGQSDAGRLASGAFALCGGFWFGGQVRVNAVEEGAPAAFAFHFYRAPNPVRYQSRAAFDLPSPERAGISIFDVAGRSVRRLDLGVLGAGHHEHAWSAVDDGGRRLPSGVYFVRLAAGRDQATQKILVLH
jgi:hypothetical protein